MERTGSEGTREGRESVFVSTDRFGLVAMFYRAGYTMLIYFGCVVLCFMVCMGERGSEVYLSLLFEPSWRVQ